jgi:hypothetical protein
MIKQNRSSFRVGLPYSELVQKKCTRGIARTNTVMLSACWLAKNGKDEKKIYFYAWKQITRSNGDRELNDISSAIAHR